MTFGHAGVKNHSKIRSFATLNSVIQCAGSAYAAYERWSIHQMDKPQRNLHSRKHQPPFVSEGDIWWASVGENVGSEINGKSDLFSRPVVIYKKLAHGFYSVVPTTTAK